jgi:hypothetical protein
LSPIVDNAIFIRLKTSDLINVVQGQMVVFDPFKVFSMSLTFTGGWLYSSRFVYPKV